jgi:cation-transporting ATPase 13A2
MFSVVVLTAINLVILLSPPRSAIVILELMNMPVTARRTLLLAVVVNCVVSVMYEQWGAKAVAELVEWVLRHRRDRKRWRDGRAYQRVEG